MVQPQFLAYQRIVQSFGSEILLESGEINREVLGNIVFSQPEKRRLLNSITHPEIHKEILRQMLKYFVLGKLSVKAAGSVQLFIFQNPLDLHSFKTKNHVLFICFAFRVFFFL